LNKIKNFVNLEALKKLDYALFHVRHHLLASLFLNSNLAAIKKRIEWRLQVQIALFAEVNLAPSRLE
jgi:hypothetical protein